MTLWGHLVNRAPLKFVDPTGHKEEGACSPGNEDETCKNQEEVYEAYWKSCVEANWEGAACQPSVTPEEAVVYFVLGMAGGELVFAGMEIGAAYVLESVGTKKLSDGVVSAGGYTAGSLFTGEEIDPKDLVLAFIAGVVTPESSGAGIRKVLTGMGWGAASNAGQSLASQSIGLVTGAQTGFSVSDLAVNAVTGAVGGVVADPLAEQGERMVEKATLGFFLGAGNWLKALIDGGFSWLGGQIQE